MGKCASTKYPLGNCSKLASSTRLQILTPAAALRLLQNEESINLNLESSTPYQPISAGVVPLIEEKSFCGEFKSVHDTDEQSLRQQREYQEEFLRVSYNQKQPSEHQVPEFSSESEASQDTWSPKPRQSREQIVLSGRLQKCRPLPSAQLECKLRGNTASKSSLELPGLQNVPQDGFTKLAFRDFVKNIPGSNLHKEVVLAEFEQLWSILSGGEEQISFSRLLEFYNNEKSREEHNLEIMKTSKGNDEWVSISNVNWIKDSNNGTSIVDMSDNMRPGANTHTDFNKIKKCKELLVSGQYHRKMQTTINKEDGYQHQLTLGELDQTQSEDDEMAKNFSLNSSSTKTLSYPSTNMQAQITKENTGDDNRTDDSPSIIISKPTAVPEPLRLCSPGKTQSRSVFFSPQNEYVAFRDSDSIKKMDSMSHQSADSPKQRPEIFQDFVFYAGSEPMKRKRITVKRPINKAGKDQGHWEWFEDLDRVSNNDCVWKRHRQKRQNHLKQLRGGGSLSLESLDLKRLALACKEFDIPQNIGEDIASALIAGEKLSTVDLLNSYGQTASVESLRRFYKWSCANIVAQKTQPKLFE